MVKLLACQVVAVLHSRQLDEEGEVTLLLHLDFTFISTKCHALAVAEHNVPFTLSSPASPHETALTH